MGRRRFAIATLAALYAGGVAYAQVEVFRGRYHSPAPPPPAPSPPATLPPNYLKTTTPVLGPSPSAGGELPARRNIKEWRGEDLPAREVPATTMSATICDQATVSQNSYVQLANESDRCRILFLGLISQLAGGGDPLLAARFCQWAIQNESFEAIGLKSSTSTITISRETIGASLRRKVRNAYAKSTPVLRLCWDRHAKLLKSLGGQAR